MIREPAVAGQFYSASPDVLERDVARYLAPADLPPAPRPAIAVVSPHAGLMYSGHVAGAVLAQTAVPRAVILLGPNHTGLGPPISVYAEGAWRMPGGDLPVDGGLASAVLAHCPDAVADTTAHRYEHSLEVQLPFLRRRRPDVRIVPIVLGTTDPEACRDLGRCLAAVVRAARAERPLLLASTDLNHYEPDGVTRQKDRLAIDAILALDPDRLVSTVRAHGITMCGVGPTTAVLHAARALGATDATLVRYATSADAGGDDARVVGYAGLLLS